MAAIFGFQSHNILPKLIGFKCSVIHIWSSTISFNFDTAMANTIQFRRKYISHVKCINIYFRKTSIKFIANCYKYSIALRVFCWARKWIDVKILSPNDINGLVALWLSLLSLDLFVARMRKKKTPRCQVSKYKSRIDWFSPFHVNRYDPTKGKFSSIHMKFHLRSD